VQAFPTPHEVTYGVGAIYGLVEFRQQPAGFTSDASVDIPVHMPSLRVCDVRLTKLVSQKYGALLE
jgi:hypothetical protein